MNKKINIIGMGYIGLPTALMFATSGVKVVGSDYNRALVEQLNQGKITFEESGLPELFEHARTCGIEFDTNYHTTDIYIVAVPTPYDKVSKKIDPVYVIKAVRGILDVCEVGAVIIIESTVSPSTIDRFIRPVINEKGLVIGRDIHLAHAPERIIPGNMVDELKKNARTIGVDDRTIGERIKKLYESFCEGEIVITDIRTAEMTKVVENTYRDINIAFANELAKICRSDDLDVYEIIRIANKHPRVNILQPGPGVGGHCISVDPWFLVGDYPGLANIILAARKINDSMPEFVLERVHQIMKKEGLSDLSKVGLYGLTYKENVDDVRESPTLQLLEAMERHLAPALKVFDPWVSKDLVENQYHDFDQFLTDVEVVVIMVAHQHIKDQMSKLKGKVILDTKNVCHLENSYKL
ncbi:MAG: nucleotide sugar dehydrogenase [Firmicutes bacterium HGW-Firmicutes-19]|nr:MAG: nucleotide sugar dehydrogenase [Firmicutes bacterium HGW-Firmicutes-19]